MSENDGTLTPEQEDALQEWAYSNPPEQTAEEAEIENMAATVESAVASAEELSADVDALELSPLIKDKGTLRDLRRALNAFLAEYDPEPDEWGEL